MPDPSAPPVEVAAERPPAEAVMGVRPGRLVEVAGASIAAAVGYRSGVLPGGLVGVLVGLAALGWWIGASSVAGVPPSALLRTAWRRVWPPVVVALLLACAWVLASDDPGLHVVARGQGLAVVGGYLNWHVRVVGPGEGWAERTATPLVALWWASVAVQAGLVALGAAAATRPRARRRPGERDPLVLVAGILGLVALGLAVGVVVSGAGGASVLLAAPAPAAALLLGVATGAQLGADRAPSIRSLLIGLRWPATGVLAVALLVARPGSGVAAAAAIAGPLLAVVAVAGWALVPARSAPPAWAEVVDPVHLLVALAVVHGPCLALAAALVDQRAIAAAVGLLLAGPIAALTAISAQHLSDDPDDVQRRLVLVPPLVVGCLLLLLSLTGAFHWVDTGPRPPDPPGLEG